MASTTSNFFTPRAPNDGDANMADASVSTDAFAGFRSPLAGRAQQPQPQPRSAFSFTNAPAAGNVVQSPSIFGPSAQPRPAQSDGEPRSFFDLPRQHPNSFPLGPQRPDRPVSSTRAKDEVVHDGVTCGFCGKSNIRGVRYKCVQCDGAPFHPRPPSTPFPCPAFLSRTDPAGRLRPM